MLLHPTRNALRRVQTSGGSVVLPRVPPNVAVASTRRHFSHTPSRQSGIDPDSFLAGIMTGAAAYHLLRRKFPFGIIPGVTMSRMSITPITQEEIDKKRNDMAVTAGAFKVARQATQSHEALRNVCFSVPDLIFKGRTYKDYGPLPSLPTQHQFGGKKAAFDSQAESRIFVADIPTDEASGSAPRPDSPRPKLWYVAVNAELGFGGKDPRKISRRVHTRAFEFSPGNLMSGRSPFIAPRGPAPIDRYLNDPDTFRQACRAFLQWKRSTKELSNSPLYIVQFGFRENTIRVLLTNSSDEDPCVISISELGGRAGVR